LHNLLGISSERSLLESPKRGSSWESFMIEQIINREMLERPGSLFYFFRTHAGAEIDLVIDRGSERIGYEFKCSASVVKRDWTNLQAGSEQGVINSGFIVYMGERDFSVAEEIRIVHGENLLLSIF
jgi:hypothetical protein